MRARRYQGSLKMVVCDWAGTTVDHGCLAPLVPFVETFRRHGVELTTDEARGPMGLGKQDHLRALLALPRVAAAWQALHGRSADESDVKRLFELDFVPLQLECVERHSELIAGLLPAVEWLRSRGIKLVTTTGYFREAAERCWAAAERQGFVPDANLCGSDVPAGRPAPWMIFRHMERFGIFPPSAVLKIGDTLPDIAEGQNAGAWTACVVTTSSEVGLSQANFAALSAAERGARVDAARRRLIDAGPHAIVDSIAELPQLVGQIEERLGCGEHP